MIEYVTTIFITFFGILFLFGFRIVQQYELGVTFTLGKYTKINKPGLHWILPAIQILERVDMRQQVMDLPAQEVMTKDQVNLRIDGVVFYKVENAAQAIINIVDIKKQLSAKATSELKEILGNKTMKECLADRQDIAEKLKSQLELAIAKETKISWGITVIGVQINNVNLPQELTRAMAKAAEATQEKEARLTKAEGEKQAAFKMKEASDIYSKSPSAMRLRELQTYQEIGNERNTLMMVIPSGMTGVEMATSIAASEAYRINRKKKNGRKTQARN